VLPYASYLRVYEPLHALPADLRESLTAGETAVRDTAVTLEMEQRTVLARAVTSSAISVETGSQADVYVMRREGRTFFCPVDMPLRSWLSMTSLIDAIGGAVAGTVLPPESMALADQQFLRWRRDNPRAVPHIRQVTWGVPRTWFALVAEEERSQYGAGDASSVRYRARMLDARRRATNAHRTLRRAIDDSELLEELSGLGSWLTTFHHESWVEVDYAGVAQLLGERLGDDHSADEIHRALDAISRGDIAGAGVAYRTFEERWRMVNAFERAN
jgi:hypothetical protein